MTSEPLREIFSSWSRRTIHFVTSVAGQIELGESGLHIPNRVYGWYGLRSRALRQPHTVENR